MSSASTPGGPVGVVADDERAVAGAVDVELDAVGPELHRPRERRDGVLRGLPAGPPMGQDEGHRGDPTVASISCTREKFLVRPLRGGSRRK